MGVFNSMFGDVLLPYPCRLVGSHRLADLISQERADLKIRRGLRSVSSHHIDTLLHSPYQSPEKHTA
jgi:hypothetical protein